jgi:hypothetical protein
LSFRITGFMVTKSTNPVILSITVNRQNPLDSNVVHVSTNYRFTAGVLSVQTSYDCFCEIPFMPVVWLLVRTCVWKQDSGCSFSMMEHLHILVVRLRLTWISVTGIGGLAMLVQCLGRRDLRTLHLLVSFYEVSWKYRWGTFMPNCEHTRTSRHGATGNQRLPKPRKVVHWKPLWIFWTVNYICIS